MGKLTISDNNHGGFGETIFKQTPLSRDICSNSPVTIGSRVWDKATILPCSIGVVAIIGANAVVTHDVPPNSIVVGNPSRIIKTL